MGNWTDVSHFVHSLLRNPKTYSKQFAMSASDYMAAKAAGMASAVTGMMPSVPVPKKYVDSAAKTMTKTAISAINAPAKQGRWAARSVYKGCKKIIYGKAKYKEMKIPTADQPDLSNVYY